MACSLTSLPLLFRADSGLCSLKIEQEMTAQATALNREIAFIIKMDAAQCAHCRSMAARRVADAGTVWTQLREGKRECIWSEMLDLQGVGSGAIPARRIYRLTERTIDKQGQSLLEWRTTRSMAGPRRCRWPRSMSPQLNRAVRRSRHARAVSLGVQDRHGFEQIAIR